VRQLYPKMLRPDIRHKFSSVIKLRHEYEFQNEWLVLTSNAILAQRGTEAEDCELAVMVVIRSKILADSLGTGARLSRIYKFSW